MTKDIIIGIAAGLVCIVIVVGIGSFIGFALSPGDAAAPAVEAPDQSAE